MEQMHYSEKIYDLLENKDFLELEQEQKEFIRKSMSEEEYSEMRATIIASKAIFMNPSNQESGCSSIGIHRVLTYRIEFYKVAAVVIFMLGSFFFITKINTGKQTILLAEADTVFIKQIDTVVFQKKDTIEIVKEKLIYHNAVFSSKKIAEKIHEFGQSGGIEEDCLREFCPSDMQRISKNKTKGDLSEDKELVVFTSTIN